MFCRNPQNGRYVWIEFFIAMAHCLLRTLDLLSIGVVVLHLQRSSCWKKYSICIDKRIAILEFLTQRHKLGSQFPYLLCKFESLRSIFAYNSFIKRVQLVTLNILNLSFKTEGAKSRRGNCLVLPHASYGPDSTCLSLEITFNFVHISGLEKFSVDVNC